MMLYARSCERPSKSSARVFLPSSVSNSYSFSTLTQGRSRRFFLISSFRSACSASSLASSSRATCHSSRVSILCSGISSPSSQAPAPPREPYPWSDRTLPDHEMSPAATRKLVAALLEPRRETKAPHQQGFHRSGRYWARTSDPQLVELVLSQLS